MVAVGALWAGLISPPLPLRKGNAHTVRSSRALVRPANGFPGQRKMSNRAQHSAAENPHFSFIHRNRATVAVTQQAFEGSVGALILSVNLYQPEGANGKPVPFLFAHCPWLCRYGICRETRVRKAAHHRWRRAINSLSLHTWPYTATVKPSFGATNKPIPLDVAFQHRLAWGENPVKERREPRQTTTHLPSTNGGVCVMSFNPPLPWQHSCMILIDIFIPPFRTPVVICPGCRSRKIGTWSPRTQSGKTGKHK